MKTHPREQIVTHARRQIAGAIQSAAEANDLTYGELTAILSGELSSLAKYQIRQERHPNDPEKPGGLA